MMRRAELADRPADVVTHGDGGADSGEWESFDALAAFDLGALDLERDALLAALAISLEPWPMDGGAG